MFKPLFTGALVRLAAPTPEDKAAAALWTRDDEYMRLLDDDPIRPLSEATYASYDAAVPNDNYHFLVRTLEDDRLIGFVVLHSVKWGNQSAWLALGIGASEYRGKGYGRDMLRLILNYAFSELNLYRVNLTVMEYNAPAVKAYERVGFVLEGRQRGAVQREGKRHDLLYFGMTREDWLAAQE